MGLVCLCACLHLVGAFQCAKGFMLKAQPEKCGAASMDYVQVGVTVTGMRDSKAFLCQPFGEA